MNVIYSLDVYTKYYKIFELWNCEVGFIYPITEKVIKANVVDNPTFSRENSFVAIIDDEVVGFVISKIGSSLVEIPEYQELGWISLMYVSKKYRKRGIGTELLTLAEEGLFALGVKEIFIGKDMNNFFPGIPIDFNNLSPLWFKKRGYNVSNQTHDLIAETRKLKRLSIKNNQYTFRLATSQDHHHLVGFVRTSFSNRWAFDVEEVFKGNFEKNQVAICLDKNEIIAFCKINDSKRGQIAYNIVWQDRFDYLGGIGPLGVKSTKRQTGLGRDIVVWSINYLLDLGVSEIVIDWTGLLTFYQQFGFEVWKSYFYASKQSVFNNS